MKRLGFNLPDKGLHIDLDSESPSLENRIILFRNFLSFALRSYGKHVNLAIPEFETDTTMKITLLIFRAFIFYCSAIKLSITRNQIKALFTTLLIPKTQNLLDEAFKLSPVRIPDEEINISAHFSCMWLHCAQFLAPMYCLNDELNNFSEVFSSSVFTTFCLIADHKIVDPNSASNFWVFIDNEAPQFEPLYNYCIKDFQ